MLLLALFLQPQLITIRHAEPPQPSLVTGQIVYSCDNATITFEYENNSPNGNSGAVKRVIVSGRDRSDVANYLTRLVQGRWIQTVTVVHCPVGPRQKILGEVVLSQSESARKGLPPALMFEFDNDGIVHR